MRDISMRLFERLPALGILAFSLCSVASVHALFAARAAHPSEILWFAAAVVELTSAWLVWQATQQLRTLLRSRISKEDRRFHVVLLVAFLAMALLSLGLSTWANALEFGNVILGLAFPALSVSCAVGLSLPAVEARREQDKVHAKAEQERAKAALEKAKARQEAEAARQEAARAEHKHAEAIAQLGKARATYEQWQANPTQTHAEIAQALGISRQAVDYHFERIAAAGLLSHNGRGA